MLVFLAKHSQGITARDLNQARIMHSAEKARALLAQLEAEGALTHTEAKPGGSGHITLTYIRAAK